MSMDFLSKNKPALTLAGVTIFGAVIFAATTGTPAPPPEPEVIEEKPAQVEAPAQQPEPAFSFADMAGEANDDAVPDLWGDEPPEVPSAPSVAPAPREASPRRPRAVSALPAGSATPPEGAEIPQTRVRGEKYTLQEIRGN